MWQTIACVVLTVSLLATSPDAFAMGGSHEKTVHVVDRPELESLVNRECRVYGHWLNFRDWFFFSGDTEMLNRFLKDLAALEHEERLVLIIHAGHARKVAWVDKRFSYDWQMDWARVVRGNSQTMVPVVDKVHVWLGGNVSLGELQVPVNIRVVSGGEIEKFVAEHEARRKQAAGRE